MIELIDLKKKRPIESIKEHQPDSMDYVNFKDAIENNIADNKISIIAEIKKASPSAGIIVENYNPVEIANIFYKNKATCLSVLTEEDFFLGSLGHIYKIKSKINLNNFYKQINKLNIAVNKLKNGDTYPSYIAAKSVLNYLYKNK